ncbi:MAG: ImmA/IrrE family metallo-endopeptidase [Gammaproteobacteria bacterium]|nr:ImmA/IrrE family metallo-endopeptidase [Gammaproteobacteria bacterium]
MQRSDRRTLATEAIRAAAEARAQAKVGQATPICIYDICQKLGVVVRFNNINMEGMYQRGTPPRIHLSAHRPLVRRNFNCAHELGHHVFGHGSSIDELCEDAQKRSLDPKEFLADAFAGFALMPLIGLRRAFSVRHWDPALASAAQLFTIACEFGVGYSTLLTHLSAGVSLLSRTRAADLQRVTPKALRTSILGEVTSAPLIVADHHYAAPTIDAETETLILFPPDTTVSGDGLRHDRDLISGRLLRAERTGIVRATTDSGWAVFVRIAIRGYVGLAQYRHLDDDPDEENG